METPRVSMIPASEASVHMLRVLGTQIPAERVDRPASQGRERD